MKNPNTELIEEAKAFRAKLEKLTPMDGWAITAIGACRTLEDKLLQHGEAKGSSGAAEPADARPPGGAPPAKGA